MGPRILGVHSGKGGVGKTTVAVNVACLLAKKNRVGMVDADIDCPDAGRMLGIEERMRIENNRLVPVEKYNVKIASTAFMGSGEPIMLRGPQKHHALMQLINNTDWGELDYMIVDLPPGTSDVPLSLMQVFRPEMILVTTPQGLAVMDAEKSASMARKLGVPVLGLVENMSGEVFGSNGNDIAGKLGVPFLGSVPMDKKIVELGEAGIPAAEDEEIGNRFKKIIANLNLK